MDSKSDPFVNAEDFKQLKKEISKRIQNLEEEYSSLKDKTF